MRDVQSFLAHLCPDFQACFFCFFPSSSLSLLYLLSQITHLQISSTAVLLKPATHLSYIVISSIQYLICFKQVCLYTFNHSVCSSYFDIDIYFSGTKLPFSRKTHDAIQDPYVKRFKRFMTFPRFNFCQQSLSVSVLNFRPLLFLAVGFYCTKCVKNSKSKTFLYYRSQADISEHQSFRRL